MAIILMMLAKMATLGFIEIKLIWNKVYGAVFYIYDVTRNISSHESIYIVDVFMWPKFSNSSISTRKVILTSNLKIFYQKKMVILVQAP